MVLESLRPSLNSEDVGRKAIALGALENARTPFAGRLASQQLGSHDASVRRMAFSVLMKLDQQHASPILVAAITSSNPQTVGFVLSALSKEPTPSSGEIHETVHKLSISGPNQLRKVAVALMKKWKRSGDEKTKS